jgi:hypothetical protein
VTLILSDTTPETLPEQVEWVIEGDRRKADELRGIGLQLKDQLRAQNVNDDKVYTLGPYEYPGGVKIAVQRQQQIYVDLYRIFIYWPPGLGGGPEPEQAEIPELEKGQFYWVPGCKARYDIKKSWENNIPNGELKDETILRGVSVSTLSAKQAGLPAGGVSPDGSIARSYRVASLPGNTAIETKLTSFLELSAKHIPPEGEFSISCVVVLNKEIEPDYTFSQKTNDLDCGYQIYNPIKPRVLRTEDGGETWGYTCPGSIAPILGVMIPSRFTDHYVDITWPWPSYSDNFINSELRVIGYREVGTICDGEPTLTSEYSTTSPYWDKVTVGSLTTLSGEFTDFWEDNTSVQNTAPYVSYCRFVVDGNYRSLSGRAVAQTQSGAKRYATVEDASFSDGKTTFILKDYQHQRYIKDANPSISFGDQPFPVCHPEGYLAGINLCGLFWYNGNRILAGKISDFQNEAQYSPIITNKLELDTPYHVVLSYAENGETTLYVTKIKSKDIAVYKSRGTTSKFYAYDSAGAALPLMSGTKYQELRSTDGEVVGQWLFSSNMLLGLPRFYRRALSSQEAKLLLLEAFNGVFVADDFEAAQLVGSGFKPVTI